MTMVKSFDPLQFRNHFPAVQEPGIYLDSAATALKPQAMIDATQRYYSENGATVHRSNYQSAQQTTAQFEQARQRVASLLNAASAEHIVWTKGTTEAINLIAQSYARPRLKPGDEILVTGSEHHSNLLPWLIVAEQTGAKVVKLPLNAHFMPDLDRLNALLTPRTKLLAIGQMSNVTGGCPDLRRAIQLAHANNTVVVVDGAQGIVHTPPDVVDLDIDFYAFSAHKLYGPTGIGALYGRPALLNDMQPWQGGGKMLQSASFDGFTAQKSPYCFEAGTPNVAGVIGLNAVLAWLDTIDMAAAEQYACSLADLASERLAALPGFISYRAGNSSLLPFNFSGHHHHDIATLIAEQGIALRAGEHCAQPLLADMGVSGTLRASFAPYNQPQEVEALFLALKQALAILA